MNRLMSCCRGVSPSVTVPLLGNRRGDVVNIGYSRLLRRVCGVAHRKLLSTLPPVQDAKRDAMQCTARRMRAGRRERPGTVAPQARSASVRAIVAGRTGVEGLVVPEGP